MRRLNYLILVCICSAALITGCSSGKERYSYREAGITALTAGDYEGAIAAFDLAVETSKGIVGDFDIDVLKYRAEAEFQLADYEAAAHTYDILIQIDKERPEYLNFKCIARAQAGDLTGAQEDYRRLAELDPEGKAFDRTDALLMVGAALEAKDEWQQALSFYEETAAGGETSAKLFNRMGLCKAGLQDYEGAMTYFKQGQSAPDGSLVPELSFNMGVVCEYQGDFAEALTYMEQYKESLLREDAQGKGVTEHGAVEEVEREIAFLKTR